jgi:hypothetical protein
VEKANEMNSMIHFLAVKKGVSSGEKTTMVSRMYLMTLIMSGDGV